MLALVLGLAYFLGAVPFAVLVGRILRGIDVRRVGSGNTGARNTFKTAGVPAGILVAVLDAGKAALAAVAGAWLLGPEAGALAGCAAVVGHCFSPYLILSAPHEAWHDWRMALRSTGGKGLASGAGVLLAVAWPVALLALAIFAAVLAIQRKDVTLPSVLGSLAAAPFMWYWTGSLVLGATTLLVAIVVIVKHLPDLGQGFTVEG